ncbi:unnamed protein product [Rotaria sp. Silwood2]|nr:unnamed protein product [Rotaria sp. Silwood2]CAF2698043.1 unnamed protein product [Rotaria sp. Silwood2]CAF2974401.1 unnamed protein product [Rotaria sp. Silwood2]CAF3119849.1 unnamed protein product [Rotaria sp. Silwood2]CAF3898556.1 unnamed protein product [Rotaria sp. Silwood2]
MHQVCSSDFVSTKWLAHIYAAADLYISNDFSYTGGPLFQALATFCSLAKKNLNDTLAIFNTTRFISSTMLAEDLFVQRTQSIIDAFKRTTIKSFIQPFNVVRDITHSNYLMSGLLTNTLIFVNDFLMAIIGIKYYNNESCNCFLTSTCLAPLTRRSMNGSRIFTIPGLYIGCYLVEAMRSSSLECFYNQTCLEQVEFMLESPLSFNATVLDPSRSQFHINSSIDALLSNAMIERWYQNVSWSNYYKQCNPNVCTFTFTNKYNILYIITTLIGLVGGLFQVLKLIVPHAVRFIRHRIFRAIPPSVTSPNNMSEGIDPYNVYK